MSATDQKQLWLHFHYYEALHFELENKYADFFLTSVNENVETHGYVTTTWQIRQGRYQDDYDAASCCYLEQANLVRLMCNGHGGEGWGEWVDDWISIITMHSL